MAENFFFPIIFQKTAFFFHKVHLLSCLSISFFTPESIARQFIFPLNHFWTSLYQFYRRKKQCWKRLLCRMQTLKNCFNSLISSTWNTKMTSIKYRVCTYIRRIIVWSPQMVTTRTMCLSLYLDQTAGSDHYHLVNQGTALRALSLKKRGICIDYKILWLYMNSIRRT